jgi:dephospho-CoA kinase
MARDGIDREAAARRMNAQPSDEFYTRDGVTVLINDTTPEALTTKAQAIVDDEKRRWC